jgi:hypothetical protein
MLFSITTLGLLATISTAALAKPYATAGNEAITFKPLSLVGFNGEDEPADGLYTVEWLSDGTPNITYRGVGIYDGPRKVDRFSPIYFRDAEAPDATGVGCDNISLNHGDTDNANNQLQNDCGNGLGQTVLRKAGNVVAFFCLWQSGPVCTRDSSAHANQLITDQCGQYEAGSYSDGPESGKNPRSYSYGYTNWREHSYCNIGAGS